MRTVLKSTLLARCAPLERETASSVPHATLMVSAIAEYGWVINLDEDGGSCPQLKMPFEAFNLYNGIYLNGKLIICGTENSTCFSKATYGQEWQKLDDVTEIRKYPDDIQMSDSEWWITGGLTPDFSSMSDTLIYTDNLGSKNYAALPTNRFKHNIVKINNTHFMLTGGSCEYGGECRGVWMFDRATETWTQLQDSGLGDSSHAGMVTYPDGQAVVVVAGGFQISRSQVSNSTFIFDLNTQTWRKGPDLPMRLYGGASVQLQDTFLIVSGNQGMAEYSWSIFKFVTSPEEGWLELPQRVPISGVYLDAILVPEDFIECNL